MQPRMTPADPQSIGLPNVLANALDCVAQANGRDRLPIGIFDSGLGGTTVLRELYNQLPNESILYFADTARLPYGSRSREEIQDYVAEILDWMADQGVKMVIMACNTSSALALDESQGIYDFPVLGLIHPGAQAAVAQGKSIGVISTQATANSNAYRNAIQEINPEAEVWQTGCPEFVSIIEQNRIHEPETRAIVDRYLAPMVERGIDTLIYGCTHYPHLAPVVRSLLPAEVTTVDPAIHVVAAAIRELDAMGLRSHRQPQPTRFCTSGDPELFSQQAIPWIGYAPEVEGITLPSLAPAA
jgi:glutamate racemase